MTASRPAHSFMPMSVCSKKGATQMSGSIGRIGAMTLRYGYLLRKSWPRLLELVYWPTLNMIVWGLLTFYFSERQPTASGIGGGLLAAVMLWDVLLRGQLGLTYSFLEEIWSRNIANLMMSPLHPGEMAGSLMVMSLIRLVLGMTPVTVLAIALFDFNIYGLGLPLIGFFANLVIMSWVIGLVVAGLVLRNGMGAESLAWSAMMLLLPVSCVYYPVAVLPSWLQWAAWSVPPAYVFEGLRAVLLQGTFRADLMVEAFALNLAYLGLAFAIFLGLVRSARRKGSILAMGE
jgi:ABC-2 type transport system permease protein